MVRLRAFGVVILTTVAVSGCGPTKPQFDAVVEVMKGSKSARDRVTADCIAKFNPKGLKGAALVLDVPEKDAKKLACSRLVAAMTDGRLNYDDLQSMLRNKPTPKIVRALQGR